MTSVAQRIIAAVSEVAGDGAPLHAPVFRGNEQAYVGDAISSTFVSSVGAYVTRFEQELAAFTGAKAAVAVVNGTAALHVALLMAGVRRGDEVIVPALTFIATANAVSYCGASPHFADSEPGHGGLCPQRLRAHLEEICDIRDGACVNRKTGRVIRAMIPVHVFGHPARMDELMRVAEDFHLAVVEDAAESLGSRMGGRHTGTFGLAGALSFNGNKIITTGGGGAILFNDAELAARARHLTTTAKVPHAWEYRHDAIGFNYRMPNLNAALGCAQLEALEDMLRSKRALRGRYGRAFADVEGVSLMDEPESCESNFWLQTLVLDEGLEDQRDEILEALNAAGFMSRPVWGLLSEQPPYSGAPRAGLAVARSLARRIINIPSSAYLGEEA